MNKDTAGEFYLLWNKSYASCSLLPCIEIKLKFWGKNNSEVFYSYIENCSGNKVRCKNNFKKKNTQKHNNKNIHTKPNKTNNETLKAKRIELIRKMEKADVLNFSYSPFICFLIFLLTFPPPPFIYLFSFCFAFSPPDMSAVQSFALTKTCCCS